MKKIIILIIILITPGLWVCGQAEKSWKYLHLNEDECLSLILKYSSAADIGQLDWLQLEIRNNTDKPIIIKDAFYSLNREDTDGDGKKYVDPGAFGRGNKYDLIHFYHDRPNPSRSDVLLIKPNGSLYCWKYLTNYTSVLLDGRKRLSNPICSLLDFIVTYISEGKTNIIQCRNKEFCFIWKHSDSVSKSELVNRLTGIMDDVHYRWVNSYVFSMLMNMPDVVREVTDEMLVGSIIKRRETMSTDESILILSELEKRQLIPNKSLTEYFAEKIKHNQSGVSDELLYYWDNRLLDDLLSSKLPLHRTLRILEISARKWNLGKGNSEKVYLYLKKKLKFDPYMRINSGTLKDWTKKVKILAISRSSSIINYLKKHIYDRTTYFARDWTGNPPMGMIPEGAKPDLVKVKISDIAFVSLLRALNQFEFKISESIGTKYYSMFIENEILTDKMIKSFKKSDLIRGVLGADIGLTMFEREIKLNKEMVLKIENKIKTIKLSNNTSE